MSFLPYDSAGAGSWVFATLSSTVTHGGVMLLAFGGLAPILTPVAAPPERPNYTITLERLDTDTLTGVLERQGQANSEGADTAPPDVPVPETAEPAPPDKLAALAPDVAAPPDPPETRPEPAQPADATEPDIAAPELAEPVQPSAGEILQPVEPAQPVEAVPVAPDPPSLAPVLPETPPESGPLIAERLMPTGPLDNAATVVSPVAPLQGAAGEILQPVEPAQPVEAVPVAPDPPSLTPVLPETPPESGPLIAETLMPTGPLDNAATVVSPVAPLQGVEQAAVQRETVAATVSTASATPVSATTVVSATTGSAAIPAQKPAAPPTAQDLAVGELIARIRATPAKDCLLALPRRDGAEGVGLAMVAASESVMAGFADALLTAADGAIRQTRTLIDPRQCPALAFVRANRDYPATRLGLAMDAAAVPSGGRLTGAVRGTAGRYVLLLLIDNNGVVQDLQRFLAFSGNVVRFDVPVTRAGPVRDTSQLLLAIASDQPPATLQSRDGQLAQDVFSGIPEANGRVAAMGLATFDVQ